MNTNSIERAILKDSRFKQRFKENLRLLQDCNDVRLKLYTNFQKDLKWRIPRPNCVAPYKGLQVATAHTAATARNTGANPFTFRYVHWVLLHALDQRLYVPSEGRSNGWMSCSMTQVSRLEIRTHNLLIRNTRVWIQCSWPLGHDTSTKHIPVA